MTNKRRLQYFYMCKIVLDSTLKKYKYVAYNIVHNCMHAKKCKNMRVVYVSRKTKQNFVYMDNNNVDQ